MTPFGKALVVAICMIIGLAIVALAGWAEAVEPVTAFKTSDGSVYLEKDEAISYEKRGELLEFIEKVEPGSISIYDRCRYSVALFILKHRKELCKFLSTWEVEP